MNELKTYKTRDGEEILYCGEPNLDLLEELANQEGDIWHSGPSQGLRNTFPEIVYQTAVFFWYGRDFEGLDKAISWRLNYREFAVRKRIWLELPAMDTEFRSMDLTAMDWAYNALRNYGAIPLYVKGLFSDVHRVKLEPISVDDRYQFYIKNYKKSHAYYMALRRKLAPNEVRGLVRSLKRYKQRRMGPPVKPRKLKAIAGNPKVSYIIPTMMRQDMTYQLLKDLSVQTYLPYEAVVVDATPEDMRNDRYDDLSEIPFRVIVKWQTSKGSCRARNEAIDLCTGDYIIFGDDDIRIQEDFVENHIRFLQTNGAGACNGLDLMADHLEQGLTDLEFKLDQMGASRWIAGASNKFSNANSCVAREHVQTLGGNDINYDGGYGEDGDFGMSLSKIGVTVMHNPFAANLHLKPPTGGYRFWGNQARILGKNRKKQPWEMDHPVRFVRPVPSPTVMYQFLKQFDAEQRLEYKYKYFIRYIFKGSKWMVIPRLLMLPWRLLMYKRSVFYAKRLMALGVRTQ